MMLRCDTDPNIVSWSSEEVVIPYRSPLDGKLHRYFVDFKIKTAQGKTMLVEIKPLDQTKPPKQPKKITKQFINKVAAYAVNEAKWKSAQEYCENRLWSFVILTENDLGITS